ncbi:hypothetical protein CEXT_27281 [Caerostris extrusa]|uniref:Uncharacterized protein n=1 Tax=Caerostris extrusa TaxID=172846 RepID=A0AAV4WSP9_CAEEX|nr:hypothetical protein CEXT_27281 [Caerostris extrusa]
MHLNGASPVSSTQTPLGIGYSLPLYALMTLFGWINCDRVANEVAYLSKKCGAKMLQGVFHRLNYKVFKVVVIELALLRAIAAWCPIG